MNGRTRFEEANRGAAIAHLRIKRSAGKYVLWVEGPDDCVVLERFAADCCCVKELSGRKWVQIAVQQANSARLDGFAGLVDRDFDDADPDTLPPRLAFISRRFNDLEAAMLACAGSEIISDLVRRESRTSINWLNGGRDESPLDLLATYPVAAVGALRKIWRGRTEDIARNCEPVDAMIARSRPGMPPTIEDIAKVVYETAGISSAAADAVACSAMRLYNEAPGWRLVRGKDMVRALACVFHDAGDACYFQFPGIEPHQKKWRLAQKVHEKVIALFDFEVLRHAGTAEALRTALDPTGESVERFLHTGNVG
jgi:hypothetical protein